MTKQRLCRICQRPITEEDVRMGGRTLHPLCKRRWAAKHKAMLTVIVETVWAGHVAKFTFDGKEYQTKHCAHAHHAADEAAEMINRLAEGITE